MGKVYLIAAAVILALLIGGAAFLAVWTPAAPTAKVEKVLPDARFPK